MKQQIYLGHVRSHYVPKNKLQKAISDYIDTLDGVAFTADKLPEVKKEISVKIEALNKEHKRSTPVKPDFYSYKDTSWKNTGIGRITCHLHGIQAIDFVFIKGILNCEDKIKKLEHHKDTTVGLYAVDKNPNDVDIEWIRKNSFQIKF